MKQVVQSIVPPRGFASLCVGGKVVAVALGVVERKWVGLFDVVTAPEHRRNGYAGNLCLKLLKWGESLGAQNAYLQVMEDNHGAIALYDRLSFKHRYGYWYRAKPTL